ncbi:hypothetical protein BpHYR1_020427 [Brachionus plicatilis]|uniref:Uncharacterized protein n=1 Tax=Brachionus plicatilis TaxID=10195 RepID=A0A3M7Q8V3_BRAPC|nr:hypothetical protein BpHYR1_020427 [Brachionus plicatilis]
MHGTRLVSRYFQWLGKKSPNLSPYRAESAQFSFRFMIKKFKTVSIIFKQKALYSGDLITVFYEKLHHIINILIKKSLKDFFFVQRLNSHLVMNFSIFSVACDTNLNKRENSDIIF